MKFKDVRKKGFKSFKPVNEVKKTLSSHLSVMPKEKVNTVDGLRRILAEDVKSKVDIPHFSRSAMDGYAVKAKDTFGASLRNPKRLKIVDKIKINEVSETIVGDKEAIEIPTGAPIPPGANAVIKLEDVKRENEYIEIYFPLAPFKNVAKKGEDVKEGEIILKKGRTIRPQEIALLLASNKLRITVYKKPTVAIITTGSELVKIGQNPQVGQIIETNSYTIASACEIYGAKPIRLNIVKDDEESLSKSLEESLNYDIIVFTGGSSVGEHDLIPYVINKRKDSKMLVHGIAMRPGSPTAIFMVKNKPIFCLPGFPVATMMSFETFVIYTIRKMMEATELDPRPRVKAILNRQIPSRFGRRDYVRVKIIYNSEEKTYYAEPIRSTGSGIISSMVKADGVMEIPEDLEGYEKNSRITVKLYLPR
ncbi:MAG: molybdopterin molybdenumtransferase MoeA [Candidatus Lokiarchaeota archaeon]|nr:molybdopterin molybdenumtransferase MoeA [Candidatus Lokiarchaeota archaeon]